MNKYKLEDLSIGMYVNTYELRDIYDKYIILSTDKKNDRYLDNGYFATFGNIVAILDEEEDYSQKDNETIYVFYQNSDILDGDFSYDE